MIGPQLDLPSDVTPTQLEELLNGLLSAVRFAGARLQSPTANVFPQSRP